MRNLQSALLKTIVVRRNLESSGNGKSLNEKKYKSQQIVSDVRISTHDALSKCVTSGSCSDFKGKSVGIKI